MYGKVCGGSKKDLAWWNVIFLFVDGDGWDDRSWFSKNVVKVVGNRSNMLFWLEPWVDGDLLCERFRIMYNLAIVKIFQWHI